VDSRLLDEQNSRMKLFVTTASAASWGSRCSALSQHLFWCKNRYNYGHWSHYSSSLLPRGRKFGSITEKDRIKNASSRSKLGSELQETRKRKGGRHSRLFFGKVCLSFKKGADNILPSCGNQNKKSSFGKNQYMNSWYRRSPPWAWYLPDRVPALWDSSWKGTRMPRSTCADA
jgi:hypothetical protein